MSKRYIIYAPIFHHKSSGLLVLQSLLRSLIRSGNDCLWYPFGSDPIAIGEVCDDDVVIYPEIVIGNPLKAKNVVRFLLNVPGVCGGDGIYEDTDMVFHYLERYKHPKSIGILTPPYIEDYFIDNGTPKTYNAIWVYKGRHKKRIPLQGVEITFNMFKSRRQYCRFLQGCKTLYTYDDNTAVAIEAKRCGCEVLAVTDDGQLIPYRYDPKENWDSFPEQLRNFITITGGSHNEYGF